MTIPYVNMTYRTENVTNSCDKHHKTKGNPHTFQFDESEFSNKNCSLLVEKPSSRLRLRVNSTMIIVISMLMIPWDRGHLAISCGIQALLKLVNLSFLLQPLLIYLLKTKAQILMVMIMVKLMMKVIKVKQPSFVIIRCTLSFGYSVVVRPVELN